MSRLVILLAEDNAADVVFFREALAEAGFQARLEVVGTGEDAIRFLRRRRSFDQAPRPDVVVLDLNLPIRNGQEVLAEMASDPVLNTIPVANLRMRWRAGKRTALRLALTESGRRS
jgi:chemotaxis family two-component system response regulator Rcp1